MLAKVFQTLPRHEFFPEGIQDNEEVALTHQASDSWNLVRI